MVKNVRRKRRLASVSIDGMNGMDEMRSLCLVVARRCMAAEGQVSKQQDKVWDVMYATATRDSATALIARVVSL